MGSFKAGCKHGRGTIIKKNGEYYDVEYDYNSLVNKGPKFEDYDNVMKLRNMRKENTYCVKNYEGTIINEVKEGKGTIIYKNGDKYEGEFKNNLKDGYGIYYYKNGERYEGQFKYDLKEGKGVYIFSDKENMKELSIWIKRMDKENIIMIMETYMKENLKWD